MTSQDLLAQFDVHKKLFDQLTSQFENSLKTINLVDAEEQRQSYEDLRNKWEAFSSVMNELRNKITDYFLDSDVPVKDKLNSVEKELKDLCSMFSEVNQGVKNEEPFQLYLNQLQVTSLTFFAL